MEPNKITCYKTKISAKYKSNSCDKRTPLKLNELQQDESILWLIM